MSTKQKSANKKTPDASRKHLVSLKTENNKSALAELREITESLLPQFGDEVWNRHNIVSLNVSSLSRLLFLDSIYKKTLDVPGVICEFGVQWGATLAQLINLRSIYEPFNQSRVIHGFDTFEGFSGVHDKDGGNYRKGDLATISGYEKTLDRILSIHESFPPLQHIKKFSLIKGNASETIDTWLSENPHAIISMAIFDMDLYQPTKDVLEKILPRLTKGSMLVFDELNCQFFPGETRALDEVIGLNNLRLHRNQFSPYSSWAIYGE